MSVTALSGAVPETTWACTVTGWPGSAAGNWLMTRTWGGESRPSYRLSAPGVGAGSGSAGAGWPSTSVFNETNRPNTWGL